MKIVQINQDYGVGSIGRITMEMHNHLQRLGHQSYVFYANGHINEEQLFKIGSDVEHKVHAMLSRISGLQGYFSHNATKRLIRKLEEINPDVVQIHNVHGNYIHLRLLFDWLRFHNIATVITLHDCWFFTGKCTHYLSAQCSKWQYGCNHCPLLHTDNVNPTFYFDRTEKCYLDKKRMLGQIRKLGVVGVSSWIANEAQKSFLKSALIIPIYNWIDFNVFHDMNTEDLRALYNIKNHYVILFVSTIITRAKGYDVMCELSRKLDDSFKLVAVGDNPDNLTIPGNVIHIPKTNDAAELAKLYSLADVCVNTTKYETFGMVTAESLSCGTPVIVYDNTASPELVGKNCGFVVDEAEGISGIIKAIYSLREIGKSMMSMDCIDFSRHQFDIYKAIDEYIAFYQKVMDI